METAQLQQCLQCKGEALSPEPRTHIRSQPRLGMMSPQQQEGVGWRQVDPGSLLTSHPNQNGEFPVQREIMPCLFVF